LAEDYLGAGLFDRAEKLFKQIEDSETHSQLALERLVHIYEREGEWEKAIESHRRLEMFSGEKTPHVAHYYCELAERALAAGDMASARDYLTSTIRSPSGALRGTLIRAQIARNEGQYREAARLYLQVIDKDRGFISEVLPELLDCYEQDDRADEFEVFIRKLAGADLAVNSAIAYAAVLHELTRSPELAESVMRFVTENDVLNKLIDVSSIESGDAKARAEALARISDGLRMLALSTARYRCSNCGYGSQRFIWQCPGCKLWETVRPVQRFQLETAVPS
jgi:lipopolysaccharide biosynthesis regulator YciM